MLSAEKRRKDMTVLADIELYDIDDLCKFLNISRFTANKLCREGQIKAIKVGRDWKVTKESLEKYLKIKR